MARGTSRITSIRSLLTSSTSQWLINQIGAPQHSTLRKMSRKSEPTEPKRLHLLAWRLHGRDSCAIQIPAGRVYQELLFPTVLRPPPGASVSQKQGPCSNFLEQIDLLHARYHISQVLWPFISSLGPDDAGTLLEVSNTLSKIGDRLAVISCLLRSMRPANVLTVSDKYFLVANQDLQELLQAWYEWLLFQGLGVWSNWCVELFFFFFGWWDPQDNGYIQNA